MKKYIFLTILVIGLFAIKIPKYTELNDLMIVDSIGVSCTNNYTLYFKEIVPTKDDNGIEYKYKIHKSISNNLNNAYNEMLEKNKKIFIKDIKEIKTNCKKSEISEYFKIKIDKIKYNDNVLKELRK